MARRNHILRRFGLSWDDYLALAGDNPTCAICGCAVVLCGSDLKRAAHVDHDHNTGAVRGLLCSQCNKALGLMRDSPQILASAIEYLVKHNTQPNPNK